MDGDDSDDSWIEIGRVDDIPRRGARACVGRTRAATIAVFRTGDDEMFALIDRCPHKGGPLSQGIVHGHASPARCTTGSSSWRPAGPRRPTRAAPAPSRCGSTDGRILLRAAATRRAERRHERRPSAPPVPIAASAAALTSRAGRH